MCKDGQSEWEDYFNVITRKSNGETLTLKYQLEFNSVTQKFVRLIKRVLSRNSKVINTA